MHITTALKFIFSLLLTFLLQNTFFEQSVFGQTNKQKEQKFERIKTKLLALQQKFNVHQASNIDSALYYLDRMLALAKKSGRLDYVARMYDRKAVMYMDLGKNEIACSWSLRALKLSRKINDTTSILESINTLGSLYGLLNETKRAELLFREGLSMANEKFPYQKANLYQNIARIYAMQNKHQLTIQVLRKSLYICRKEKDNYGIYAACEGIARSLIATKSCSNVFDYLKEAEQAAKIDGSELDIIGLYPIYAEAFMSCKKDADQALYYLNAYTQKMNGALYEANNIERLFAEAYSLKKMYEAALIHYKKSIQLEDSIKNFERTKSFQALELKYQSEQKQKDILSLSQQNKTKTALLASEKKSKNLIIIGLFLSIALLLIGSVAYRNSKRYAKIVSEQAKQKEVLLQEVHHRINNSLQITSALLAMQANSSLNDETRVALKQSETRIHAMASLHALLNNDSTELSVNMQSYLKKLLEYQNDILKGGKNIALNYSIEELLLPSRLALPIALTINELVTNSIKYAFPDNHSGEINIDLHRVNATDVRLIVADNGIGLNQEQLEDNSKTKSTKSGLGIRIVQILIKQINGTLQTKTEQGVCFEINFKTTSV